MNNKTLLTVILSAAALVIVGASVYYGIFRNSDDTDVIDQNKEVSVETLISDDGIHWHSELKILINGEVQLIPANIGLESGHYPMHTHEEDGTIHMEFSGNVTDHDVKLGEFFEQWDKIFSSECIFENCATEDKHVKMTVNGEENTDFEKYVMHDDDLIEIIYE